MIVAVKFLVTYLQISMLQVLERCQADRCHADHVVRDNSIHFLEVDALSTGHKRRQTSRTGSLYTQYPAGCAKTGPVLRFACSMDIADRAYILSTAADTVSLYMLALLTQQRSVSSLRHRGVEDYPRSARELSDQFGACGRSLVNDLYRTDLPLMHPPHILALGCIYLASFLKERDIKAWFEDLKVDMHAVSRPMCSLLSTLR
jgi:hypothetical protein